MNKYSVYVQNNKHFCYFYYKIKTKITHDNIDYYKRKMMCILFMAKKDVCK